MKSISLSQEQKDEIIALYMDGKSCKSISETTHVCKNRVNIFLRTEGLIRKAVNNFTRANISKARSKQWQNFSDEEKEKRREGARNAGRTRSKPKFVSNCAECGKEVVKDAIWPKMAKERNWDGPFCGRSCSNKYRYKKNPELWKGIALRASASNNMAGTSIELKLRNELDYFGVCYETNVIAESCIPDIFIEPNICIFADGVYWHDYPNGLKKDKIVNKKLAAEGYKVYRFWEHDIHEDPRKCIESVLNDLDI